MSGSGTSLARRSPESHPIRGIDSAPVWMPNGHQLVFSSHAGGPGSLFLQAADGNGVGRASDRQPKSAAPVGGAADSTRVLSSEFRGYEVATGTSQPAADVMMLTWERDRLENRWCNRRLTTGRRRLARWSMAGVRVERVRSVADCSCGRFRPWRVDIPVSTAGGTEPRWRPNGRSSSTALAPDGALDWPCLRSLVLDGAQAWLSTDVTPPPGAT